MADLSPQFESADLQGSTDHFNGTVGTTAITVPSTPGNVIAEVMVKNARTNPSTNELYVSFDGGTNFFTIEPRTAVAWSVRGNKTQIHIKASMSNTGYEIILNRETF